MINIDENLMYLILFDIFTQNKFVIEMKTAS